MSYTKQNLLEKVGEVFLSVITFYIAVIWRLLLPNPTNFKYTTVTGSKILSKKIMKEGPDFRKFFVPCL